MKGISKGTYYLIDKDPVDCGYNEDDVVKFDKGDVVEILKVIERTDLFLSRTAYVCFNPKNLESMTLDSSLVDLIDE